MIWIGLGVGMVVGSFVLQFHTLRQSQTREHLPEFRRISNFRCTIGLLLFCLGLCVVALGMISIATKQ